MERILQATPFTLSEQWFEDGSAVDPGAVVVTVTADDGTVIASGSASGSGTAARTFNLTAVHTALLDVLTVTWASTGKGTLTSKVEVVGGFLFSLSELAAQLPDATNAQLLAARTYAETELESALGFALVPRYGTKKFRGRYDWPLRLKPYLRAIRSVLVDGVPWSVTDLGGASFDDSGFLYGSSWGWYSGRSTPVIVRFEHGMDADNDLSPGAKRMALAIATEYLGGGSGTVDPRAERLITDDGTIVFGSSGAGQFRAPGVNEWVAANRLPTIA